MNHSRLWVVATIIAAVVLFGFVLSVPRTGDLAAKPLQSAAETVPSVSLRDSFKKGLHTLTGSLEVPNACTAVTARASRMEDASGIEGIQVELSFPDDTGVCLQVPTRVTFSTTVNAPAKLPITVFVNGGIATTTSL